VDENAQRSAQTATARTATARDENRSVQRGRRRRGL